MGYDGIANLFLQNVSKTPDKVAIVFEDEALTYAELAGKVALCVKNFKVEYPTICRLFFLNSAIFLPLGVIMYASLISHSF